jgi:ribonuclease Z
LFGDEGGWTLQTGTVNHRDTAGVWVSGRECALAELPRFVYNHAAMIKNLPVRTLTHKALTIEGYSRAAVQSYWRIPELKVGFDLGGSPWNFLGTRHWFVTHAHLDHLAAIPVFVARRRMMKMEPPVIHLPQEVVEGVQRILQAWQRVDRGRMVCELIGVKPGDEIELSREHVVTCFPTRHTVPSVGYVVWDRRKKLRPDLQGLSQNEIRERRLAGEEVTHEVRVPVVCYTGDTAPTGLDADPAVYQAQVLITEMTFYRPEHRKEKIHKFGHTHLDDILERANRFQNELIILSHFSTRYLEKNLRAAVEAKLPAALRERVHLWA